MVRPQLAWFGQKDYQQAAVVRQLVGDLNLGVEIVVRPTVRERDGLALSSRNIYLTPSERVVAPILYRSLQAGAETIQRGVRDVGTVQAAMSKLIRQEPGVSVDYLAVCNSETLEPLASITSRAVLLGAVRIGSVRLIDNLVVAFSAKRAS